MPSPSSLVLLSSRNRATMVTWRHSSPLYFGGTICSPRNNLDVNKLHRKRFPEISESAHRNCIFLKPLSRMDFFWIRRVWWIRVDDWNRWGRGWIQTGYTTPNSSRRKYQVFSFSVSGFVFTWAKNVYINRNRWRCLIVTITEATQPQRRHQRERQKSNKLRLAFLYIFLCRHCSTKTWNSLISPFMVDVNTRNRYSFCFCEL